MGLYNKQQKKDYYANNREKINSYNKEWRKNNPEKFKESINKYTEKNKDKINKYRVEWQKNKRQRDRITIIDKYGGKCICCGESNEVFLAYDHINGGGLKHHKELRQQGMTMTKWIIKNNFPDTIQILCHNCNYAKHRLGKCPHKE